MVIICSITYPTTPPTSTGPVASRRQIPFELVQAYASLFNSKDHSDVVFVVRQKPNNGPYRRLYAIRKILAMRSEYFAAMFDGEWSENLSEDDLGEEDGGHQTDELYTENLSEDDEWSDSGYLPDFHHVGGNFKSESDDGQLDSAGQDPDMNEGSATAAPAPVGKEEEEEDLPTFTPLHSPVKAAFRRGRASPPKGRRSRAVVRIQDSQFSTFKGFLYYLYTDAVCFMPLSSTYQVAKEAALSKGIHWPHRSKQDWAKALYASTSQSSSPQADANHRNFTIDGGFTSAKEMYMLADSKLSLCRPIQTVF